jgi:hypothetical protein
MENVGIFYGHLGIFDSPFGLSCDHLVHFVVIWYIFSLFGMFYQEKSGNRGSESSGPTRFRSTVYSEWKK